MVIVIVVIVHSNSRLVIGVHRLPLGLQAVDQVLALLLVRRLHVIMCIYVTYKYIYIYIYRERERHMSYYVYVHVCVYIYIYIYYMYVCIYIYI